MVQEVKNDVDKAPRTDGAGDGNGHEGETATAAPEPEPADGRPGDSRTEDQTLRELAADVLCSDGDEVDKAARVHAAASQKCASLESALKRARAEKDAAFEIFKEARGGAGEPAKTAVSQSSDIPPQSKTSAPARPVRDVAELPQATREGLTGRGVKFFAGDDVIRCPVCAHVLDGATQYPIFENEPVVDRCLYCGLVIGMDNANGLKELPVPRFPGFLVELQERAAALRDVTSAGDGDFPYDEEIWPLVTWLNENIDDGIPLTPAARDAILAALLPPLGECNYKDGGPC